MSEPKEAAGKGPVGGRKEVGDRESSQRHPPHVDENMEDAPLQEEHPSPDDVAGLPATAHGTDKQTPEQHSPDLGASAFTADADAGKAARSTSRAGSCEQHQPFACGVTPHAGLRISGKPTRGGPILAS
jgi:hypothetical protein